VIAIWNPLKPHPATKKVKMAHRLPITLPRFLAQTKMPMAKLVAPMSKPERANGFISPDVI